MASIFGHVVVGATLVNVFDEKKTGSLIVAGVISTVIPDIDVLTFQFGIAYGDMFGHRGFTHSLLFAVLWSVMITFLPYFGQSRKSLVFVYIFLSTLSHGLLDALTNGGLGVGFFVPFDETRYFFDFRPIQVSPIGVKAFFSSEGVGVVVSELVWIGIPCLTIYILAKTFRSIRK